MYQFSLEKNNNLECIQQSILKINAKGLLSHESLLKTLTLTERQEVAKSGYSFRNEKLNIDISKQLNQSPFNDSLLLDKWYKENDLNEEKLRYLHCNEWLGELLHIEDFSNNNIEKIEEKRSALLLKLSLDKLIFIQSEINSALLQARANLKDILENKSSSVIDIDSLILAFCPQLLTKLKSISSNTIDYFNEKLSLVQSANVAYRCKLFNQFPMLSRQISQTIEFWLSYISEFSQHLSEDIREIENLFFMGKTLGQFSSISSDFGDTHNQGRYAFTCNFSCGEKLVYKPRSLALDNQFYQFLDFLSVSSDIPDFYQPIFLCRKNYGWMEYVDMQSCDNEQQIVDYYYRSGSLLSVLYLLGAEDIHYRNVIAKQGYPVIIDLETLFHQRDDSVSGLRINPLNHTVLKTHFIPQYEMATSAQELAAIISTSDINSIIARPSLPVLLNQSVPVNRYIKELISGFETSYIALAKLKEQLPEQLNKFLGMDARYVARPTRIYSQLWLTACQPYFQQSGLLSGFIYDKLWLDVKKRPFLKCLIAFEKVALLQGDIPLLGHVIGTKNVKIGNTTIAADYFAHDSFSCVMSKVQRLSMKNCAAQIKIIKRSLMLGQNNKQSIIKHQLQQVSRDTEPGWLKQSQIIANNIVKQASIEDDCVFWPVYKTNHNDLLCLDSTNYRLYDGVLGLLFYLAYINDICPDLIDSNLLEKTSRDIFTSLHNENFEEDGCGAFNGLGGVVYVISHLFSLWHDDDLLGMGRRFIDKLSNLVSQDTVFDVQAGSAGAILCLLSYYEVTADNQALTVAQAFGDHLVQNFIVDKERSGWKNSNSKGAILTGFSHGSSGIAYSLIKLYQVTSNETYREIASKVIAFEQTTYSDEIGNWLDLRFESLEEQKKQAMSAWCSGAMGIGYSRFMMLGVLDDAFDSLIKPDIKRAAENVWQNIRLTEQGLCHGNFGNKEFLQQLLLNQRSMGITNEIKILDEFDDLVDICISELNENGLYPKQGRFESLGLMNGLSGIGYQILKFTLPDRMPSILMLQPPVG